MTNDVFLFETSWEVCNKVGGIYTVIKTKAPFAIQNSAKIITSWGRTLKQTRSSKKRTRNVG